MFQELLACDEEDLDRSLRRTRTVHVVLCRSSLKETNRISVMSTSCSTPRCLRSYILRLFHLGFFRRRESFFFVCLMFLWTMDNQKQKTPTARSTMAMFGADVIHGSKGYVAPLPSSEYFPRLSRRVAWDVFDVCFFVNNTDRCAESVRLQPAAQERQEKEGVVYVYLCVCLCVCLWVL